MNGVSEMFAAVLAASWRMGLVIVVLALARAGLRGRIPSQILLLGWLVVAVALLVPFQWAVSWSPAALMQSKAVTTAIAPWMEGGWVTPNARLTRVSVPEEPGQVAPAASAQPARPVAASAWPWAAGLAVVWVSGVIVLIACRVLALVRMHRLLRDLPEARDARIDRLLAACARQLRSRHLPRVILTDRVSSPAICGLGRAVFLLPQRVVDGLADDQLALVLMHEFGHWLRRDLLIQGIMDAARIVHWFNPLGWLACRWARQDGEAACDEFVLAQAGDAPTDRYGLTLLKVVSLVPTGRPEFPALGMLENNQLLTRRIKMIANFKRPTRRHALIGTVFLAALALVALTKESIAQEAAAAPAPAAFATGGMITVGAPVGWWKNGSNLPGYEVGLDRSQTRAKPASAYVKSLVPQPAGFCGMMQMCNAENFRGKRIQLSAWVKAVEASKGAQLWFRIDGEKVAGQPAMLGFDNMQDRPVQGSKDWTQCSVVLDVPDDAQALAYGFFMTGTGAAYINDFKIEEVSHAIAVTGRSREQIAEKKGYPSAPVNLDFQTPAPGK
jgi:beta-lactamase regulating signal transducer with metallopeptidase domain